MVSYADVSSKEFDLLLRKLEDYHTSVMPLLGDNDTSLKEKADKEFAYMVTRMEQYLHDALKATADVLRCDESRSMKFLIFPIIILM